MGNKRVDIYKAAGILIQDRKLLVEKSIGKDFFISPGGKVVAGESAEEALIRELQEEFTINVLESDLTQFGTFYASAANSPNQKVRMDVFMVHSWHGEPKPSSEVEELRWISSDYGDLPVGSIFAKQVIPKLKSLDLID